MDPAVGRRRRAGDDAEVIDQAVGLERLANREHFVGRQPAIGLFVERDAHAERARADARAAAGEDFAQQAHAVVEAAAELVVAAVGRRVQELRDQVAHAGEDLDAVEPGVGETAGGCDIAVDQFPNHRPRHRHRHHAVAFVGHVRRRVSERLRAVVAQAHATAGVKQLAEHRRAGRAAALAERGEAVDDAVAASIEKSLLEAVARVHGHALEDDQADAAAGTGLVIGNQLVADDAVARERRAVRRTEYPVRHPGRTEFERLQQGFEHVREEIWLARREN